MIILKHLKELVANVYYIFTFNREIIKKWNVNGTKVFPGCEKEGCYEGVFSNFFINS